MTATSVAPRPATPTVARKGQTVTLLGPQGARETLASALAEQRIKGRVATVTAGWQEREDEIQALQAHLDGRSENLSLHARADEAFREHPELEKLHRERQRRLRETQRLYDLRVGYAMAAVAELARRVDAESGAARKHWEAAIAAVAALDDDHLRTVRGIHAEFADRLEVGKWSALARHRKEIAKVLKSCEALCIAGGHVAVLLNRLRLFDVGGLLKGMPALGWSAGAMVLAERVVLYHDSPPQGPGNPEVLEIGLGLVRGVVPLPHATRRLRLSDPDRVSRFARRFAPARCVAMDDGACVTVGPKGWSASEETMVLTTEGNVERLRR